MTWAPAAVDITARAAQHARLAHLARQRHDPGRGLCEGVIYPSLSPGLLSVRAISNPGELTSAWEPSAVRLKSAVSLQSVVVRIQYKLAVYKKLVVCSIQNAVNLQSAVFRSPVRGPLQLSLTTMLCRLFIMLFRPRPPMPPSDTSAVIRVWWILFGAYLLMTNAGESYNFSIKLQIRWWMSWAWLTPRIWHHDSEGEDDIPHGMWQLWHVNTKYLQLIVNQSMCYIYIFEYEIRSRQTNCEENLSVMCVVRVWQLRPDMTRQNVSVNTSRAPSALLSRISIKMIRPTLWIVDAGMWCLRSLDSVVIDIMRLWLWPLSWHI